jgi:hypothetical protein
MIPLVLELGTFFIDFTKKEKMQEPEMLRSLAVQVVESFKP